MGAEDGLCKYLQDASTLKFLGAKSGIFVKGGPCNKANEKGIEFWGTGHKSTLNAFSFKLFCCIKRESNQSRIPWKSKFMYKYFDLKDF